MRPIRLILMAATVMASTMTASTTLIAQTVTDDARCLLVSSTYARTSKEPKAQQVAQAASAFYLGRVDGRYPPAALRAALAAELKTLNATNAPGIMNACAARIAQAETRIQGSAPALPPGRPKPPAGR